MCNPDHNITTRVLSVPSAKAPFEQATIERRALRPDDVLIDIQYCGIFSAEHGIAPIIEVIRADQVDAAYERVLSSDVRYRFVIDMATL
jgi:Zn-dependent alcohol dehydrogenases